MTNSPYLDDLGCHVTRITYDFETRIGALYMPVYNCTDMMGCIQMFVDIDENVERIDTFAGSERDTFYVLIDNEWRPLIPSTGYPRRGAA